MKYISVGAVVTPATEKIYTVSHSGYNFSLVGESARMWLSGRYGFSQSENIYEEKALRQLLKMGLVVPVDDLPSGEYRALTRCTIVPAKKTYSYFGLSHRERTILKWLREAGLTLTMGELVFHENNLEQFGREVLKNEAASVWKKILTLRSREVLCGSTEDMIWISPTIEDTYITFKMNFQIQDLTITVTNESLAHALQYIVPSKRDVILLTFFMGYTDTHIGKILNIDGSTVAYRRRVAVAQLKKILEDKKHER